MDGQSLSRRELATRWGISVKTVDRLRETGQLSWIDLSTGQKKPLIRFLVSEIERFERERGDHAPSNNQVSTNA